MVQVRFCSDTDRCPDWAEHAEGGVAPIAQCERADGVPEGKGGSVMGISNRPGLPDLEGRADGPGASWVMKNRTDKAYLIRRADLPSTTDTISKAALSMACPSKFSEQSDSPEPPNPRSSATSPSQRPGIGADRKHRQSPAELGTGQDAGCIPA